MMLSLYFNPAKFPRTIGRKEWKEIWRWKRITEKRLAAEAVQAIHDLAVYGSTMLPEMKRDVIDRMVNPPLLIHDKQELP